MGKEGLDVFWHYKKVAGFDVRKDRRNEASKKYGIKVFDDFKEAIKILIHKQLLFQLHPSII